MHRRIARSVFILLCGAIATALGVASATLFTPSGRSLLARILTDQSRLLVRGSLSIGSVRGGWLSGFDVDNVVIRDTAGVVLVSAPHVEVRYNLSNLLAGRVVFVRARLVRPDIHLLKHRRTRRMNYEEIFKLGEKQGGASPLIEINNLEIVDGRILLELPWNPDGRLRTARQVDSALAFERGKPGRRIERGAEGLMMVRTIDSLNAKLPVLRVSTPDRQPVTLEIEQLAARVSDPALAIRDLRGTVRTRGDSLLFEIEHAELPGTALRGAGRLDWPSDTILYHYSLTAPKLALADLRFISPNFPDFRGSARVTANSLSGLRTEYDIRELAVGGQDTRVTGRLVAISDVYRGLGFRNLDLTLGNLDLEVVRPYLDTLPFYGRVTGPLQANGFFDEMQVSLNWQFLDAKIPGGAQNQVALSGRLTLGGAQGMVFHHAELSNGDLDLRTVRRIAPAVILEGRLGLQGSLDGPLQNVVFDGRAEHRDQDRPASRLRGKVRLDTRGAILGLETDVVLDSLVFAGIRRSFPSLTSRGALGGPVKLSGFLDHLAVDAQVGGAIGQLDAKGRATLMPPKWGADSLRLGFTRLDLAALMEGGPNTALQGFLSGNILVDSAVAPLGQLSLSLGASRIREVALDSATALIGVRDSVIRLDTLRAFWAGGRVDGGGTLGWTAPKSGRMSFYLAAFDLSPFDSLSRALSGLQRDTAAGDRPLAGRGVADLTLEGALGNLRMQAATTVDSIRWLAYRAKRLTGKLSWAQSSRSIEAELAADSLWRRQLVFGKPAIQVRGRSDSLDWALSGSSRDLTKVAAGGRLQDIPGGRLLHADSLSLELLGRRWELHGQLNARLLESRIALDTVRLVTEDGSGSVELAGEVPRSGAAELSVTALGVQLRDVYSLLQRDTTGIGGVVALDARVAGTAAEPEIRGSATITGPMFGDFQAPLMRSAFDYRDHKLRGNLTFWRTGKPVVEADVDLPLDLALKQTERRQLPGPLNIVVRGDSIDLALVEAFTPNLRQVSGLLNVDAQVQGTWETPRLAGHARFIQGAAYIPGLGVRYHSINGGVRLAQDSILSEGISLGTGLGELTIGGGIQLEKLTAPSLNLTLSARNFELIDVKDYMTLNSTGEVRLTGTLLHPVLTGRGRLQNSVIYFADLVQKEIVDLEDPLFADLADTLALRKYSLGANFQSRFYDSLAVRDLQMEFGEAIWLRSNEANFQLEGRVTVNKTRQIYRIDGILDVPRGTYTLKAGGFINRTFTVERGTVRYFGNLNADLDVEARHVVRTPELPQDIPVIVHITGTLDVPKLELTTPPDRPPMSEPELLTLLALGTTEVNAAFRGGTGGQGTYALGGLAFASSALSSELQQALASTFHLDLLEIRPGVATSGFLGAGGSPTQFAFGKAITPKLFVSANAGFCLGSNQPAFNAQNLGATLQYRFRRDLQATLSAEPVQTCLLSGINIYGATRRYQFGAELRWDRGY